MTTRMKVGGLLLLCGILFAAACGAVPAAADHGGPHCDELPANINPSHPDWDDSLDADDDGIGCDDDGQPMWQAPAATTTTTTALPSSAPPAPAPIAAEPDVTG